jgi:predicted enzyme related to lactoylglutathione lyase
MATGKAPTFANGKLCYIEIPATDIHLSATFYKDVFGWRVRTRSNGEVAFDDTVGEVSGVWVTGRAPATTPGFLFYIMVDDIGASMAAVVAHGGTIVQQVGMDAPEITARFSDPAGNVFGLYQQPV